MLTAGGTSPAESRRWNILTQVLFQVKRPHVAHRVIPLSHINHPALFGAQS